MRRGVSSKVFPIRGVQVGKEDYKQNEKHYDENKRLYHQALVVCINDLTAYNKLCKEDSPMDVLTLEGVDLASTKAILKGTNIKLCNIDIVSKNVQFQKIRENVETGVLYHGELEAFLNGKEVRPRVYDVSICDFCATWDTQKQCVRDLFDQHLLDEVSFLAITCSKRTGKSSLFMFQDEAACRADIAAWAEDNGYSAVASHPVFHYGNMYCIFYKVIHLEKTMNYVDGIKCKTTAFEWLYMPLDITVPPK